MNTVHLAALWTIAAGISMAAQQQAAVPPPPPPDPLQSLYGKGLELNRLIAGGRAVPKLPKGILLRFPKTGEITGFAGVNRFNGSFSLENGVVKWKGNGFATTRMAGEPERMQLEAAFLKALAATSRLRVSKETLTLVSTDGTNSVRFVVMKETAGGTALPVGETLTLTRLTAASTAHPLPQGRAPTLTFLDESKFGGFAGVNQYSGAYKIAAGGNIQFNPDSVVSTMMAGPPERMKLEDTYLTALRQCRNVNVSATAVRLSSPEGKSSVLEFTRPAK